MRIVKFPSRSLLRVSVEVTPIRIRRTIAKLRQCIKEVEWGIPAGMAAPQIGINKRVFIAEDKVYINPKILWQSKATVEYKEGCYSLNDNDQYYVKRSKSILLSWFDENGKQHKEKFYDDHAEVIQHEFDHLEGILINTKGLLVSNSL